MTFSFNSKETYLAYRAEWKQRYLSQILTVREAKQGIRDSNRQLAVSKCDTGSAGSFGSLSVIWEAYRNALSAKEETDRLLAELQEAKLEASRQVSEKRVGRSV